HNDVFRSPIDRDQSRAGQYFGSSGEAGDVYAFAAQSLAIRVPLYIGANTPNHTNLGSLTRGGDRLISAFASKSSNQRTSGNGLTGGRQPLDRGDVVQVTRADDNDLRLQNHKGSLRSEVQSPKSTILRPWSKIARPRDAGQEGYLSSFTLSLGVGWRVERGLP